ncbi:hypothetical protein AB8O64_12190 [Streptomyces sp. QH1-20]|uniref:hypothetical protein n=1 Tax=Streptomyces sp. QH1-20 TaxID=3240934 RepID=UPI003518A0A9
MAVYEYLPIEMARLGVVRKATGLSLDQVQDCVRFAEEREARARIEPAEPLNLCELAISQWESLAWQRIAHVMAEQQMAAYNPEQDYRAVRWRQQRSQRLATEVADAEKRSGIPAEILRHRVYRITAEPAASRTVGESPFVVHLMGSCLSEAVNLAWNVYGRPGGLYQQRGYRITQAEQVLPGAGEWF